MIVIDKSGFGLDDGTHNADQFIFDIVQDETSRFAFFSFMSEVQGELRAMSANRAGGQVE